MTLATVGADGRPSTRIVLIKGVDARGLVWYTNYDSRKGRELAHEPHAALQFHWVEARARSAHRGRGRESLRRGIRRLLRHASTRLANRGLGRRRRASRSPRVRCWWPSAAKAAARHGLNPPRPPHWGGYRLVPDRWEFWQGRRSRLHDRVRYALEAGRWVRQRLAWR